LREERAMTNKELHRYKDRLLELRERLTGEVRRLAATVLADARPAGEHDQHVSEAVDKAIALEENEEQMRRDVAEALERIEAGTYGVCRFCGGGRSPVHTLLPRLRAAGRICPVIHCW
jgi:RNA polymerase-binding transcription factor DksA